MLGAGTATGAFALASCATPMMVGHAGSQVAGVAFSSSTNFSAVISPDGRTIVIDALGLLWVVPADGGEARQLTDAFADIAYPSWSPDGRRIAFQSYRSGNFHIWTIASDGTDARQLTSGFADNREPFYTPDGASILFSSDAGGSYRIYRMDIDGGSIERVTSGGGEHSEPCISPDGTRIAYLIDSRRIVECDAGERAIRDVAWVPPAPNWTRDSRLFAPTYLRDGTLAYVSRVADQAELHVGDDVVTSGEDVFPFRASQTANGDILYTADGAIRLRPAGAEPREIPFKARVPVARPAYDHRTRDYFGTTKQPVRGIAAPALSPDAQQVAFCALNALYLLRIGDPIPRVISGDAAHKAYPAWSPDGRLIAYSCDRTGTPELWLHELATGSERQVTQIPDSAALMCCWSGSGKDIAFLDHRGALHLLELESGDVRQVYEPLWLPGRPSFGPQGERIALAAFKPVSNRFREGLSEVLTIELQSGRARYTPVRAERSLATRGVDGPVWSPDGNWLAYVFASRLWIQPVARDGSFAGEPRKLSDEIADAPSWSGASDRLLYLRNGELRIVPIAGGRPVGVPLHLTWARARAPERQVISGVRIWDARSPRYREGDVVIESNRIADILAPGSAASGESPVLDGSGLTLLPGLIDMHTHRQVHGYGYGHRMALALLAMGITASRSPGGAAYETIEDRESIDTGKRIGPRHFVTGEALDGGRIFYNFMRPVTEPGQLDDEMSRAEALGYDMVKTYVRMDHAMQARVIESAHALGMPISSHYHYPSLRQGGDCTEHLGATNRFGFSRTISLLGTAYEDVARLFAAAKAGRTPTLFSANALLPDHPELVADPRIRKLLPPWDVTRMDGLAAMISAADRGPLLASLERNVQQIKDLMALGWHVHTGTDAPIDTIGVSYHLNLRALTHFGISPYEALLTATRHAGEFLDAPLGTIERGKLADLILVSGDPLADIAAAADVKAVISDGRVHKIAELMGLYPESLPQVSARERAATLVGSGEDYFWHRPEYVEACRTSCCAGHSSHAG
jgi:Tol biopolymer transport system component